MLETEKECSFDFAIEYREGVEDLSEDELRLIDAHLPELLKLMLAELADKEE